MAVRPLANLCLAVAAVALPNIRDSLLAPGFELMGGSVAEFTAFVRDEIEKWAKVVKATGAKAE